jgi:hypothetical protein
VTWQVLVATVVGVLVAGFLVLMFLVRDPASRRIRFGVFLEREQQPPEDGPGD